MKYDEYVEFLEDSFCDVTITLCTTLLLIRTVNFGLSLVVLKFLEIVSLNCS